jgi:hypothetical protein
MTPLLSLFRIFKFRISIFRLHTGRVARGAKLDLTVTVADPAKRGGAFTRGHFSHPSSSAQHATHRGFWLVH